jgi:hypothetical protein
MVNLIPACVVPAGPVGHCRRATVSLVQWHAVCQFRCLLTFSLFRPPGTLFNSQIDADGSGKRTNAIMHHIFEFVKSAAASRWRIPLSL